MTSEKGRVREELSTIMRWRLSEYTMADAPEQPMLLRAALADGYRISSISPGGVEVLSPHIRPSAVVLIDPSTGDEFLL